MVAGAEHQAEEGLALLVQRLEGLVCLGHQVLVRGAPGALEYRVLEVFLLDYGAASSPNSPPPITTAFFLVLH